MKLLPFFIVFYCSSLCAQTDSLCVNVYCTKEVKVSENRGLDAFLEVLEQCPDCAEKIEDLHLWGIFRHPDFDIQRFVNGMRKLKNLRFFKFEISSETLLVDSLITSNRLRNIYLLNVDVRPAGQYVVKSNFFTSKNIDYLKVVEFMGWKYPLILDSLEAEKFTKVTGFMFVGLNHIPPSLFRFKSLKFLELPNNHFTNIIIPANAFPKLEVLEISNMEHDKEIKTIDIKSKSLKKLRIERFTTSEMPKCIAKLKSLQQIVISFSPPPKN
jgi:hypothetical protein